ncbi:DUF4468 domain-containing protein [Flectobacillus rivi]|uniref:DUF4468 domain-containing protein n=1 Tax=Flectobacillus rivi TaxID=2984209 RepID=A0ABT6YYR7_9BACT|nr:DUF4468 domain-containing protein [Flectobacillus rivi]MDI9874022.1 DUF4468 domain-containing protein [Flectobacillus rivi]
MKKAIIISALLLCSTLAAMSQNVDEKLSSIQGKWVLDDKKNVTIQRIIEAPSLSKEEIYNRALNFFAYHYIEENIKIINVDKSQGLVVARGVFDNLHNNSKGWHAIRIDVKDGKARILVTLTEYQYPKNISTDGVFNTWAHSRVSDEVPINAKGGKYVYWGNTFYSFFTKATSLVDSFEIAIKEGNTSKEIESSAW